MDIHENITVDSNIPNNGRAEFKKYIPLINPEFSENMVYFTFDVVNDGDTALIYIKPDGFDVSNQRNLEIYSFYFSFTTFPTSMNYDYKKDLGIRDWTTYGFKMFLPVGVCGKGVCYLGIKPLTGMSRSHLKPYFAIK